MKAEGEANEKDEEDDGDLQEGEDDVFEDDDVDADPVEKSHLEQQVDPGQRDRDGADLPLEARGVQHKAMQGEEEGETVDEEVEKEDQGKLRSPKLLHRLQAFHCLSPDGIPFTEDKEKDNPCKIAD